MRNGRSGILYEKAQRVMPGGVNSPVRAFAPLPFFTEAARGCRLVDVDGNQYIDYCMSYGAILLGHSNAKIIDAVSHQLQRGTCFGTPTEIEVELAELILKLIPNIEMVRLVNSGMEATSHSIRLARAFTGRRAIIIFEGAYHGSHDYFLARRGEGRNVSVASSTGIPQETLANTIVLPYNDIDSVERTLRKRSNEIAAVLIEPAMGNVGLVVPEKGYLDAIRKITEENEVLLVFDEIITGFRLAQGGAQEYYNVRADIVALGKVMGGGFPIAAFAGREEIMKALAPLGKVYQAGTFSGNPISSVAALATLRILQEQRDRIYSELDRLSKKIEDWLKDFASDHNIECQVNRLGSMFQTFFTQNRVRDYETARSSNSELFRRFHSALLERGVFLPPSQFETCFLSTAHQDDEIDETLEAFDYALRKTKPFGEAAKS